MQWHWLTVWFLSRSTLHRRLQRLEHLRQLDQQEIEHLRRQLTAYQDSLDALTWQRRQVGAEAKWAIEQLQQER